MHPAKTQISLGIHPVWSESSLSSWRNIGPLTTYWVHSEDANQTGRMTRLFWVFTGDKSHFVGFVMLWLICNSPPHPHPTPPSFPLPVTLKHVHKTAAQHLSIISKTWQIPQNYCSRQRMDYIAMFSLLPQPYHTPIHMQDNRFRIGGQAWYLVWMHIQLVFRRSRVQSSSLATFFLYSATQKEVGYYVIVRTSVLRFCSLTLVFSAHLSL